MEPTTPTKKTLDPLALPSPEKLRQIEQRQNEKAQEIRARRMQKAAVVDDERTSAAELIQRNFRGHQARRAMKGYALDPSTRWLEV